MRLHWRTLRKHIKMPLPWFSNDGKKKHVSNPIWWVKKQKTWILLTGHHDPFNLHCENPAFHTHRGSTQTPACLKMSHLCCRSRKKITGDRSVEVSRLWKSSMFLTAEQRLVQAERRRQVLDLGNPLVHGSGEVVGVVQAAQDDAGEVDGLSEIAHQTALEPNHVPPVEGRNRSASIRQEKTSYSSTSAMTSGPLVLFFCTAEMKRQTLWFPANSPANTNALRLTGVPSCWGPPGVSSRSLIKTPVA